MVINITNVTNINSFYKAGDFASNITGGMFWGILLVGIFIVMIINLRKYGIAQAVASSGFSMLLISIGLTYLGWLNILFPIVFGLAAAGSVFYIRFAAPPN